MIFKVTYQDNQIQIPTRENTKSLYISADNKVEAREKLAKHTPYNIEFLQEISGAHLEYEQENNPDFEILEF